MKKRSLKWWQEQKSRLIASKPSHQVSRTYELNDDEELTQRMFDRLKDKFIELTRPSPFDFAPKARFEMGKLPENRAYFFVQPWNESGWLFERSPRGWSIAIADKIENTQTFLRTSQIWDMATVFSSDGFLPRISSDRFGPDLLTFSFYEDQLRQELQLKP